MEHILSWMNMIHKVDCKVDFKEVRSSFLHIL